MLWATDIMAPMSKSLVLAVFLATTGAAYAQKPDLSFEVASIHLRTDDVGSYQMKHDPAQVTWTGASLRMLFSFAFRDAWDVDGPSWMGPQCYDIVAKFPPGGTFDQVDRMVRNVLVSRWGLKYRTEQRSASGFALVAGEKTAASLQPADQEEGMSGTGSAPRGGSMEITVKGKFTLPELAKYLAGELHRPVVDQTGIKGIYAFDLKWSQDDTLGGDPGLPNVLRDRFGLRLKSQNVPVEVIIVEHIEKMPTAN
jgi:uncharacterized protein (TIGR03435 family)